MEFGGKTALVTGASRGIGREIARVLADRGCDVAINYLRDDEAAQETARIVEKNHRRALLVKADVSDPEQARSMADQVLERWGRIDLLINNAGITRDKLLAQMTTEDVECVLRTNLFGVIYTTQAVVPAMISQRWGRIVNISSSAASKPGRGQSNYAAAKGAVESFTRAMAVELASRHVLVNAVAPGVIDTEMSEEIRRHADKEIMDRLLLKRYGTAVEVAEAVAFLASPSNLYVTGEVLHLDGGMKMA